MILDSGKRLTSICISQGDPDYYFGIEASAELIAAMKKSYPEAGFGIALDIGAKVTKSEMKW